MLLLRVRLMARTGQIDSSLADTMGSAITTQKGQIRNWDKGQWFRLCPSCGPRERLQLHCHTHFELATLRDSEANSRACLLSG